ncbi:MAG: glycoside hydrolase family 127 protein [Prevotella sp.]|nr:glycoside hydrolase family 127 protein [Prevotella sp.]
MKQLLLTAVAAFAISNGMQAQEKTTSGGYPITQVPFTAVKVDQNSFWGQRIKAAREVTIPLAFSKCESEGRYSNFVKAANPSDEYDVSKFMGFSFDDTDVYKTIEGASYVLQTYPDKKLEAYIDSVLDIVAAAQEPDGYLYTARTINPKKPHGWAGTKRWEKVEDLSHEFYNLGHMVDAACAHYQATGSTKFLNIARRYADCVVREVGDQPGQACVVPGHQIAEMALSRLYVLLNSDEYKKNEARNSSTHQLANSSTPDKYLKQAKFFLDYRGKTSFKTQYSQSHRPVVRQDEAVGHAVRAGYMYAGMADVAALTGDSAYIKAIDNIWNNIVQKKYYITGGVGATNHGEAFGANYELPNLSAYNETCAAIAMVYLNQRMFLMRGDAKYIDCLERTLYNGVISGMAIDGGSFFYPNPLESRGGYERKPWFGCACCPSNLCRFIPSLPGYIYAVKDNDLFVNLYTANTSTVSIGGKSVTLEEQTKYPWDGDISIKIAKTKAKQFRMMVRIPGWVRGSVVPSDLYSYADGKQLGYKVSVNGEEVSGSMENGYLAIDRKWKKGDEVRIHFDMTPRMVKANHKVVADRGRIAIECGPLVYCAEWPDNKFNIFHFVLNKNPQFKLTDQPLLIGGVRQIIAEGRVLSFGSDGKLQATDASLTLIPYYAWAHRGQGSMQVWIANEIEH